MTIREKIRARMRQAEEGATTLEYIVLASVLVLGLVVGINMFKDQIKKALQDEGTTIGNVANGDYTKALEHDKK